jgi:RNA polymerase sigma factor (sigma-70 family)
MVLGTALTAFAPGQASARTPDAGTVNDLGRYCTACWRNARLPNSTWADCTQDVFRRLLERVSTDAWPRVLGQDGDERREFLRAIDAVKKRVQRTRKHGAGLDAVADRRDLDERRRADDLDAVRQAAAELLSDRQQRILRLSFEGWSVHEIADEMSLPPERVSDEKYKAVRKLRTRLADRMSTAV